MCQSVIQLRRKRARRPEVQQRRHHHFAETSGWELVPRRSQWRPRLLPHQLRADHQTFTSAPTSVQSTLWLWGERQGSGQRLPSLCKGKVSTRWLSAFVGIPTRLEYGWDFILQKEKIVYANSVSALLKIPGSRLQAARKAMLCVNVSGG